MNVNEITTDNFPQLINDCSDFDAMMLIILSCNQTMLENHNDDYINGFFNFIWGMCSMLENKYKISYNIQHNAIYCEHYYRYEFLTFMINDLIKKYEKNGITGVNEYENNNN